MSRRRFVVSSTVLAVLTLCHASPVKAQPPLEYTLTPLVVPDHYGTIDPSDINNSGAILTWASDTGNTAVVIRQGRVSTVTIPGSLFTTFSGMSANGTIVGAFTDVAGNSIAYTRSPKGNVSPIPVEGTWYFADPWDISDKGVVVGILSESPDGTVHGFIQDGTVTHVVDLPGATQTYLTAVNNAMTAVGFWGGPDAGGSFVMDRSGRITPLLIRGADSIIPASINNSGAIAGSYSDGQTRFGFVYHAGAITTIDYPPPTTIEYVDPDSGASLTLMLRNYFTDVAGINDAGRIVGSSGGFYGNDDNTIFVERRFPFTGTPVR